MNDKILLKKMKVMLANIHRTTAKTLLAMVVGLIKCKQIGVSSIGREIIGYAKPKHKIKRAGRFVANERVPVIDFYKALAKMIIGWKEIIIVAIDWTKINGIPDYDILAASMVVNGRGLPILLRTYVHPVDKCKMTGEEIKFIELLKQIIPDGVKVIFILDRGFCKVELMEKIEKSGFHYIVRSKYNNKVYCGGCWRKLSKLGVPKGSGKDYGIVYLHKSHQYPARLVVSSEYDIENPSKQWYLFTDLEKEDFEKIVRYYARRMEIEELFRDQKDKKNGFKFRGLKLKSPGRYDRILLVFAYAYILITLLGIWAETHGIHKNLQSNTSKERSLALWRVGRYCFLRLCINWNDVIFGMKNIPLIE